ncbi:hypothetical protein EZS27_037616, partial [termite gut metagenome]
SSCRSAQPTSGEALDGLWYITEISGSTVVPPAKQALPVIGFDAKTGKIFGNSGCNRIMGSYDVNSKDGIIKQEARTRMSCADMKTEENILNALKRIKTYRPLNNNQIALCGEKKQRPLIILQRKASDINTPSSLDGDWRIVAVTSAIIPAEKKSKLLVSFNTTKKSIHANAGCNEINAILSTDENDAYAISFSKIAATMKACPDMTLERQVITALHETQSYNVSGKGDVVLYNKDGKLTMVLTKK